MASETPLSFKRKIIFSVTGILILLVIVISIGEIFMRVTKIPIPPPYDNKEKDPELGWKSKPYYRYYNKEAHDKLWNAYVHDVSFYKYGFRKWNDCIVDSPTATILFLGDSYTESLESSDKDLFYVHLRDSLNARVYAYGCAGYGTVQEWMFLKEFIDSINPNLIVLEMCDNDCIDNYWELERYTGYRVKLRRPYLNYDNSIEYHFSSDWIELVNTHSLFLGLLLKGGADLGALVGWGRPIMGLGEILNDKDLNKILKEAFNRTEIALKKIKVVSVVHHAKLIVFDADHFETGTNWIPKACERNDITYVPGVGETLFEKENAKEPIRAWDGYHWVSRGEEVVSDTLLRFIRNKKLIQ